MILAIAEANGLAEYGTHLPTKVLSGGARRRTIVNVF